MAILLEFLYRLSFGLALAMGLTSPRLVPSGFFRVHLYVLLGIGALAALVTWQRPDLGSIALPIVIAMVSYFGAALWLYERAGPGLVTLWLVALLALVAAWDATPLIGNSTSERWLTRLDPLTGGLILGSTMAAMLLGHWYLNTPTMQLAPLKKLIVLMVVSVVLRTVVEGMKIQAAADAGLSGSGAWFALLRWLSGIVGTLVVAVMAWQTLKIPNTQSATGILYVGVIVTFIGELTALLLSQSTAVGL